MKNFDRQVLRVCAEIFFFVSGKQQIRCKSLIFIGDIIVLSSRALIGILERFGGGVMLLARSLESTTTPGEPRLDPTTGI